MSVEAALTPLVEGGFLESIDVHLAQTLTRLAGEGREEALMAAALVSRQTRQGHVCVSLAAWAGAGWQGEAGPLSGRWPSQERWLEVLRESPLVAQGQGERRPLVLDQGERLYLHRYFEHEVRLAAALRRRAAVQEAATLDGALLVDGLARYFPVIEGGARDGQRDAAVLAMLQRFAVISGGPGTGKTSTVVRLLALLVEQALAQGRPAPRVLLLAPTGKAAARLVESIRSAKARLQGSVEVVAAITEQASTIHRALGVRPDAATRYFRSAESPLVADVVLVDEASMVDVALMRHLVEAVPPGARLILLGDRHQLASVEAGSVLAELCAAAGSAGESEPGYSGGLVGLAREVLGDGALPEGAEQRAPAPLRDSVAELTKSYRFSGEGGIGQLAAQIRRGEVEAAVRTCAEARQSAAEVGFYPVAWAERLPSALGSAVVAGYREYLKAATPDAALEGLARFRVLCGHRRGYAGVEHLNVAIRVLLAARGWVPAQGEFYRGRPVLVTRNDYSVGLFNGDVGLCWPNADGDLRVFFVAPDGRRRQLAPARLPAHETAFAMSVHKSQGSEHDEIAFALPEAGSPLLTRELLYTAVTRAKRRALIFGAEEALRSGVERRIQRESGLSQRLLEARPA